MKGGGGAILRLIIRANRETKIGKNTRYSVIVAAVSILLYLSRSDHRNVCKIACRLIDKNESIGYYYLGLSKYLQGDYCCAEASLRALLDACPYHPDGTYLLAELLYKFQQANKAWLLLEKLAQNSKRVKTWQIMSNFVDSLSDYNRLDRSVKLAIEQNRLSNNDRHIPRYLSNAALKIGDIKIAEDIWREQYRHRKGKKLHKKSLLPRMQTKPYFTDEMASRALLDLKAVLDKAGIQFFLISGTLLGCIRENKILAHDKDIDIGVWSDEGYDKVRTIIETSGYFYIAHSRRPDLLLMVRHVNGIAIDVFFHFREIDNYWHAGVKTRWCNSPFSLVHKSFLGGQYLVPEDYERYLTENYGDWETPVKQFDSAIDTPNMEVINRSEMIVYAYRKLLEVDETKKVKYLNLLRSLNELVVY